MYEQCREALRILLEDDDEEDANKTVTVLLSLLAVQGNDVLRHLDPPPGLRHWLESHGLSLVPTRPLPGARPWQEEEEDVVEAEVIEDRVIPRIGDRVQFATKAEGPRGQSRLGTGTVVAIRDTDGDIVVSVRTSPTELMHLLPGAGDVIEIIGGP